MRHYYSVDTIRAAEAPLLASLPDGALMRRAAFGLATEIGRELTARTGGVVGRRVCAVVGSGDNGGDALWAATFLRRRGAAADAVLLNPDRTHRKALAAFTKSGVASSRVSRRRPISSSTGGRHLRLGAAATGGRAGVRRGSGRRHTGGRRRHPQRHRCGDRGDHRPAVHAALTVTFGGLKPVHALADCGRVVLVDIGLDLAHTDVLGFEATDVAARWPVPGPRDDKYTQGVTGVLAGSSTYPGAAVLCTGAAVAATSGMVRYAGTAHAEVLAHWPEVIASPTPAAAGRVQAWVVGPGLGTDEAGAAALWFALDTDLPVLVDADG
ncbi:bifunctional ADP-dependent (S)-NAD(P)H-hydrate dehydratase/NAD(P)H-hydrate epimerase [Mycobacterium tuberculosis variant africanum]|nr:bifunctional ADP-dependent (S)-NAD(P)H-hydrate dehydratase/NAD(P)H-hydrate epimerase [Mycobacterium tuberculosis variant africanum]